MYLKKILGTRLTINGGGYFPSTRSGLTLYLSGLYNSQATASEFVFGGALEISVSADENNPVNMYIGAWARINNVSDAVIPYLGLDYGSFSLGMTYDTNISSFKVASHGLGGMEVSLIYTFEKTDHSSEDKVQCPRI